MGVGEFIHLPSTFAAPYSQSTLLPDYVINPHPRFAALVSNIRTRRGSKVDIHMPLFRDERTPEFLRAEQSSSALAEASAELTSAGVALEPDTEIHMDAMGFGMGMCCLVRSTRRYLCLLLHQYPHNYYCHPQLFLLPLRCLL